MIRCRNIVELLASDRVRDAGVWTRLQVRMHLWMCRHCARFARQLAQLREVARDLSIAAGEEKADPPEDRLEARLLRKLSRPDQ